MKILARELEVEFVAPRHLERCSVGSELEPEWNIFYFEIQASENLVLELSAAKFVSHELGIRLKFENTVV